MAQGNAPQGPNGQKRAKPRWFNSWSWTGASFIGAVGIGLLLLTELRSGPVLAILAGLGCYYLLAFFLPQALTDKDSDLNNNQETLSASDDPRVELLVEAHQHVATLSAARTHLPLAGLQTLEKLHDHARAIIDAVSTQPARLNPVLRFFTYYLPSTADLVMDRIKLAPHAGSARLDEIDQTLARLVDAFSGFEAAVRAPDLESVDLDVELLDQALDADLEGLKR